MEIFIHILIIALSGLIGGLLTFGLSLLFQDKKSVSHDNSIPDLIRLITNEMNGREKNVLQKIEEMELKIERLEEKLENYKEEAYEKFALQCDLDCLRDD